MPFLVSGTVNDRTFDNEVVQGKALAKHFGVEFKDRVLTFRMAGAFQRFDHLNQIQRNAPGFLLNPAISGTFKGEEVSLRYFTQRRNVSKGKDRVATELLTPHRVSDFRSPELQLFVDEEYDLALFFWLSDKHSKSPLRKGGEAYYEHYSRTEDAKAANARTDAFIDIFMSLKELTKEQLIIKAKGIVIKGDRISMGRDMSHGELVRALADFAMKHQAEFPDAFRSHLTEFNGTIEVAISMGVILQSKVNGQDAWVFGDRYGGETIAIVRGGRDMKAALRDEINKKFAELFDKISKAVAGNLESVSEADIAEKMAAREVSSSQKAIVPKEGTIEREIYDQFDELKRQQRVVIEKSKVYFDGVHVSAIGKDYKTDVMNYLLEHPDLLKPV